MSNSDHYDIGGYIQKEGAIGVLVQLDTPNGLLNGELEEKVHVSPTTLSTRLEEGLDLDLLTLTRLPEDHGNAKRYELTQRGEKVKEQLESQKADRVYRTFIQMNQLLEDARLGMKEWLADSELTDPSWNTVEPREPPHDDDRPYE